MPTKAKGKSRFWRRSRIAFRRFRMTVWCLTLLLLGTLVYLNLVGVPDFVQRPLLARLQEYGLNLKFASLRLHWSRGFVAEQVQFGASLTTTNPALPQLTAREVEFNFHLRALCSGHLQIDSLAMRGGKMEWTLMDSTNPVVPLTIDHIETHLRLIPGDLWLLDDLRGRFAGANFYFSGTLTNASVLQDWRTGQVTPPLDAARWTSRLRQWAEVIEKINFATPPEVRLDVNGDAKDLTTFDARLAVRANDADTPWGRAQFMVMLARMLPATSNELPRAEISLQAQRAETRWGNATNLDWKIRMATVAARPDQMEAATTLRTGVIETRWGTLAGAQLKSQWTQCLTNATSSAGRIEFHADTLTAWLTRAADLNFAAQWATVPEPLPADPALGFWTNLLPYQVSWSANLGPLRTIALLTEQVHCAGEWTAPKFSCTDLDVSLYQGAFTVAGAVDVATREAEFNAASSFELKRLAPLLGSAVQAELNKVTWAAPPQLNCAGTLVLPAWTNQSAGWLAEVTPTLRVAGNVALTNASYEGVFADQFRTRFAYTNHILELPELLVQRPEGEVRARHRANERTGEYYFQFSSTINPMSVASLLGPEVREGLDLCEFTQPPVLQGELWGRWDDPHQIGFRGSLALTNFSFHNEALDAVTTQLNYTNLVLELIEPRLWRGPYHIAAPGITADFNARRIFVTNLVGEFFPITVAHLIGPMVTEVMSPYHFATPPTAQVNGFVSMHDPHDADITFIGGGQTFEALNFHASNYRAEIIWQNNLLTVTNTAGDFYGGQAAGWAHFTFFEEHEHAAYAFKIDVTNSQLSGLVADITGKSNSLEGRLTGRLVVTNASTETFHSWSGYGQAQLRDGLLWELPIFGVLSGPLDAIMPGVGNSRFTEATGTFGIVSGVVQSTDLEMRSPTMRLQYRGAVDFDGVINARVTAEPLRDTPIIGPVVSTVLWPVAKLFAYSITGTMQNPKSEPVYIPGPIMYLFSPFQSLGNLFTPAPEAKPKTK